MQSPSKRPLSAILLQGHNGSAPDTDLRRPFLVGATVVLVVAAIVSVVAAGAVVDEARAEEIRRVLGTTTVLGALGVFGLSRATWRQLGDQAAVWAGCGALMLGVAAASRPELLGILLGDHVPDDPWLAAVAVAAPAVAALLFAAGLVPRLRWLQIGPTALTAAALTAVAALALSIRAAPGIGTALSVSQLTGADGMGAVAAGAAVTGAWLALAVGYTVRGIRRRWLYTWAGLLLFAVTLSGLAAGAAGPANAWGVGAAAMEAAGVLVALVGSHFELTRAYEDQTLQLSDSALDAETAEVRERVRAATLRVRRHDLVNAVCAVDGAAMILEREFEQLSDGDREVLTRVLGSGTARLRRLLEAGTDTRVSLAHTAADVAGDPGWPTELEVDVTPDLVAIGSPGETAEAVRQLVDYASRRAPSAPVTLRGERDGEWVVLRVEDRGLTMPRSLRRTVTDPDGRRAPGRDDAMGVRLAARLLRGQGGDVWVEARPGGGTSFGICLPGLVVTGEEPRATDA